MPVYFPSIRPSQTTLSKPLNKTQSNVVRFMTVTYQKIMQEIFRLRTRKLCRKLRHKSPGFFRSAPCRRPQVSRVLGSRVDTTRFDPGRVFSGERRGDCRLLFSGWDLRQPSFLTRVGFVSLAPCQQVLYHVMETTRVFGSVRNDSISHVH